MVDNTSKSKIRQILKDLKIIGSNCPYKSLEEMACADGYNIQKNLADIIKEKILNHLKNGNTELVNNFKSNAFQTTETTKEFISRHEQNTSEWGEYINAVAFADLTKTNIHVMFVKNNMLKNVGYLYKVDDEENNTFHLINYGNTHWSAGKAIKTIGDGKCLYNALAQHLQTMARREQKIDNNSQKLAHCKKSEIHNSDAFIMKALHDFAKSCKEYGKELNDIKIADFEEVIKSQAETMLTYNNKSTKKSNLTNNKTSTNKKPSKKISQQIARDYKLALKLAKKELDGMKGSPPKNQIKSPRKFAP